MKSFAATFAIATTSVVGLKVGGDGVENMELVQDDTSMPTYGHFKCCYNLRLKPIICCEALPKQCLTNVFLKPGCGCCWHPIGYACFLGCVFGVAVPYNIVSMPVCCLYDCMCPVCCGEEYGKDLKAINEVVSYVRKDLVDLQCNSPADQTMEHRVLDQYHRIDEICQKHDRGPHIEKLIKVAKNKEIAEAKKARLGLQPAQAQQLNVPRPPSPGPQTDQDWPEGFEKGAKISKTLMSGEVRFGIIQKREPGGMITVKWEDNGKMSAPMKYKEVSRT